MTEPLVINRRRGRAPLNRRVILRALAGIAVSAMAIVVIAQLADIPSALATVAKVDVRWLVLPGFVIVVQMWVRAARWAVLLSAVQPVRISARVAIWPTTAGYFGNVVLPVRLGEVVRIVLISRRTPVTATAATASVLIERVVDLLALLAFAAAAYGAGGTIGWLPLAGMLGLLLAFGLALRTTGWLAAHVPVWLPLRVRDVLVRLLGAFRATGPSAIALAWLLSLLAWLLDAVVIYLCAGALGVSISPSVAILLSAGGALGAVLPAAVASFGTYELGAVTVAAIVGIPADNALQVALMSHVLGVVTILGMGVIGIVLTSLGAGRATTEGREVVDHAADFGPDDRPLVTTAAEG